MRQPLNILDILDSHRRCFTTKELAVGCSVIDEIADFIAILPKAKPQPIEEPTWVNGDGERVLISSMTDAHLDNTVAMLRRHKMTELLKETGPAPFVDQALTNDDPRFVDLRREQVRRQAAQTAIRARASSPRQKSDPTQRAATIDTSPAFVVESTSIRKRRT